MRIFGNAACFQINLTRRVRQSRASGRMHPLPRRGEGVVQNSRTFELERDLELGAVGFDLALGVELQIEL